MEVLFLLIMTKKFDFDWRIPVPEHLLAGCVCDRWTEEKDNTDFERNALFKVDEYGFFIYWKSEGKVISFLAFSLGFDLNNCCFAHYRRVMLSNYVKSVIYEQEEYLLTENYWQHYKINMEMILKKNHLQYVAGQIT